MIPCNFIFKFLSENQQINCLRKKGVLIGTRKMYSSTILVYMLSNRFIEVWSNAEGSIVRKIKIFSNLQEFQGYMEVDTREKLRIGE